MHPVHLHEHDANQGAQSSGEFLGMTGNSGWYLLGSAGATVLMVIFLWGVLGVSLLLCLLMGLVLCGLSVTYVFALKNNKPEHYDTDFFESALVEAGILGLQFGPRTRRPTNPFSGGGVEIPTANAASPSQAQRHPFAAEDRRQLVPGLLGATERVPEPAQTRSKPARPSEEPMVARSDYDGLQEQLTATQELLEDALVERGED